MLSTRAFKVVIYAVASDNVQAQHVSYVRYLESTYGAQLRSIEPAIYANLVIFVMTRQ